MTQTPRTPVKWIVPIPDNDPFGRKTFTMVCRGNADIGSVLNYFVYEASREVEHKGWDSKVMDSVPLENRLHQAILSRVDISKKTLIAHIKQLEEWELIVAHGRKHHYDVCHKNVTKAILHPPEEIKSKLRGIHVAKCKSTLPTLPEISRGEFEQLCQQVVNQHQEIVNLHLTIVDLHQEIVALHFIQSSKDASQQGLNPVFDAPNSSNSSQEKEESSDAPFVASPSFSSEQPPSPSYSQEDYETSDTEDVTQASQESELTHGHITATPDLPGDDYRGTVSAQHPLSAGVDIPVETDREVLGMGVHGYEKGVRDEPGTDGIWDRDAGGSGRDTALHPALDQHCVGDPQEQAVQETQAAQEVTQQIPLSQGLAPALEGDARERSAPPVATALLLSHTLQATSLLSEMSLDALLSQPRGERTEIKALLSQVRGQMTRMTQSEPIRAGDTSSEATSQSTETAPMKPVSQNKTVQAGGNKKPRGKIEKPVLTPEELAFKERCTALQVRINEWRGYELPDKGPVINERKRIQDLAREYSDDTIERIRTYLFNRHWKWSKPDNRFKIGAQILWEESKSVLQILKEEGQTKEKPPGSNGGQYQRPNVAVPPPGASRNLNGIAARHNANTSTSHYRTGAFVS